jgi:hypothetical protein
MVQNFTQNDLVSFLYKEVDYQKFQAINKSIENDWDVFQEFKVLRNAKSELPEVTFHPAPATLSHLLDFSREK